MVFKTVFLIKCKHCFVYYYNVCKKVQYIHQKIFGELLKMAAYLEIDFGLTMHEYNGE